MSAIRDVGKRKDGNSLGRGKNDMKQAGHRAIGLKEQNGSA